MPCIHCIDLWLKNPVPLLRVRPEELPNTSGDGHQETISPSVRGVTRTPFARSHFVE